MNHDPGAVGRRFGGTLDVRVRAPNGDLAFKSTISAASHDHRVPDNYTSTRLAPLELESWPLRPWQLEVRVVQGDPEFVTARTTVNVHRQDNDVGMGGLVNYTMIVPGGIFALLSFAFALVLARKGSRVPLAITGATYIVVLLATEIVG